MLIGLISDTHIGYPGDLLPPHIRGGSRGVILERLPDEVMKALRGVDLILHGGDIYLPSVLDQLETVAPVVAAWGDDDMPRDFVDDKRLKSRHILNVDGVTLWLTHAKPFIWLIDPDEKLYFLEESSPEAAEGSPDFPEAPDVIVHGHIHVPRIELCKEIEYAKDILVISPGSATFPSYVSELGTIGLLTINSGKVKPRIVELG